MSEKNVERLYKRLTDDILASVPQLTRSPGQCKGGWRAARIASKVSELKRLHSYLTDRLHISSVGERKKKKNSQLTARNTLGYPKRLFFFFSIFFSFFFFWKAEVKNEELMLRWTGPK